MESDDIQQIDWEEVWKTLEWGDDQEAVLQRRLHRRAEQYAVPLKKAYEIDSDAYTVLTFDLGAEKYGVDVAVVQAIHILSKITRVPGTPHFYRGVVNVRGEITSVLDLRRFFAMSVDDGDIDSVPHELVIVRAAELEIGLLAHHVEGVMTIPQTAVEPVDDMNYALGVTMGRLVLLDISQMFTDTRLIVGGVEE